MSKLIKHLARCASDEIVHVSVRRTPTRLVFCFQGEHSSVKHTSAKAGDFRALHNFFTHSCLSTERCRTSQRNVWTAPSGPYATTVGFVHVSEVSGPAWAWGQVMRVARFGGSGSGGAVPPYVHGVQP